MIRTALIAVVFGCWLSPASSQSWSAAYENGLASGRAGAWMKARESFKQASAYRTEDVSGPTLLPGPATDRRRWRNGAPYSPNFLAAYSAYREAHGSVRREDRETMFRVAAEEFGALVAKGQVSYETVYFLSQCYVQLGDRAKSQELAQRLAGLTTPISWRVDTEIVSPEEVAVIADMSGREAPAPRTRPEEAGGTQPGTSQPGVPTGTTPTGAVSMATVAPIATKFALVIGNSECKLPGAAIPFAADDAQLMRETLSMGAGYPQENVDVVINATSAQLMASARALAERVTDGATVTIFFAGAGVNINGKDYLAGVDTESPTDIASMAAKTDLYQMFMAKGARIFAFFEVHRPKVAGRFFGMEVPMFGSIAQAQATMPGDDVYSIVRGGRTIGAYVDAFTGVVSQFRSNRIPIQEFGWQVFYRIRTGDTGSVGGSSRQTPTLPVLTNMAADARF